MLSLSLFFIYLSWLLPLHLYTLHFGIEIYSVFQDVNTKNSGFPYISTPEWEKQVQFYPRSALQHIRKHSTWVTLDGDKPANAVHHNTIDILNSDIVHDLKKKILFEILTVLYQVELIKIAMNR